MATKIEYATDTLNIVTGCTPISEGCASCYAKRMANRLAGRYGYDEHDPFKVTFHPDKLADVKKWRKPRIVFVSSMGDLFAHARIRLWDATGCYPLRTLRSGKERYETWSRLIPEIQDC